ncbi:hypothetical protein G5I_02926 [Acromyrmex echinatior]|uniref:Uncharacterized protein n=1 Tax=Acromyrmex echinatior TaxID=103372 RepID=F4WBK9_ACREC|nr:hypothetical protein G5I_02926 [Acromyrmex echinatior]
MSTSHPISPFPSSLRNDKHKQDLSNTCAPPRNTNNANNNSTSLEEARKEYLISPNGRSSNISRDGVLNHGRANYPRDNYLYEHDRLPTGHMDMPMLSMTLRQFLNHAAPPPVYLFQLLVSSWSELLLLRGKSQLTSNKKKNISLPGCRANQEEKEEEDIIILESGIKFE